MSELSENLDRIARFLEVCGRDRDAYTVRMALREIEWASPRTMNSATACATGNFDWKTSHGTATAAPVVVGEDMVRAALCCRPFMGQQYDDETVFDMFAKLPAEKRKEAMRFAIAAALSVD